MPSSQELIRVDQSHEVVHTTEPDRRENSLSQNSFSATSSQKAAETGYVDISNKYETLLQQQAEEEDQLNNKIRNKGSPTKSNRVPTALSYNNSPGVIAPDLDHSLITF